MGESLYLQGRMLDDIDNIAVFDSQGELVMKTDSRHLKENVDIKRQHWFRSIAPGSSMYVFNAASQMHQGKQ